MDNLILVSNWEKVDKDDFYLSDNWNKEIDNTEANKLQKHDNLYIAYIVDAVNFAIYTTMDSDQVFIDGDGNIVLRCETAVINNKMDYKIKYEE
jgi:hypothetical protein